MFKILYQHNFLRFLSVGSLYVALQGAALADVVANPSSASTNRSTQTTRILRAGDGHYYANTLINGVPLRMIVDTGATKLALSRSDAAKVGYVLHNSDFNAAGESVTGSIRMAFLNIPRLRIGTIELKNVQAVVFDSNVSPSLLGMNVLNKMSDIAIHNAAMTLTP